MLQSKRMKRILPEQWQDAALGGGFKRPRDLEGKPHGVRGRHRPLQQPSVDVFEHQVV